MLKIYNTLDEVPEALREHYKKSDGRYIPDLSDDHPVLTHNKTLLTEKSTATARVKELEADIAAAADKSLPRGHVAVAKADAELLNEVKALGPVADIKVKLTEHETLKADATKRQREDKLVLVAKELGYDNVEAFKRLPGLPDFDIRDGKDGKKTVIALVKDGDKTTEKDALEFLEASADHAPFLPALKSTGTGVTVHGSSSTTTPKPGDTFAWARDYAKQYGDNAQPVTDLAKSFAERTAV